MGSLKWCEVTSGTNYDSKDNELEVSNAKNS